MANKGANTDRLIASIAAKQHGVVSTRQLERAALSRPSIAKRLRAGRLHRIHRGVYAVGHTKLTFEGRCMAAALALGAGAVVSHQSAAALWGVLKPHSGPIHVTVPGDGGRKTRAGIEVHRSRCLIAGVSILRDGIRVTKAKRTLQDLHRTSPQPVLRRAVRRALDLGLISSTDLADDDHLARSDLERLFLRLCRRYQLPQPEVNARAGPYEVDFLWPDRGLIVEVDGFRHHGHREAFERDRAKDARLQSQGYRVLRFTHRQLTEDRTPVIETLRRLLGQRPLSPNL